MREQTEKEEERKCTMVYDHLAFLTHFFYRKEICMAHNVFIMCEKERDGE
jgi:hypothetical protein